MNRDFRFFWTGQVTSTFGSAFTVVALPLVAIRRLGASPAKMGLLVAAGTLPLLLFGLVLGMWVDRLSRRRPCLIGCELLAAATIACVAAGAVSGWLTIWGLGIAQFVLGLLSVITESAYFVHLRSLVRDDKGVVRARARLQGGEHAGAVLGRALAGPAAAVAAVIPFAIDCASYLLSAVSLLLIRAPERRRPATHGRPSGWRELVAGLAVIYREGFLRRMMPFVVGQQIVAGMTVALCGPFVLKVLKVPTSMYGLVFVFLGLAAVAGSAAAGRLAGRVDPRGLTVLAYAGVALSSMLLPFAGGALPVAMGLAAIGIGLPSFFGALANVGVTGFITVAVSEEKLGRTGVGLQLLSGAGLLAGAMAGGLAAQQFGIRPTLWLAAGISAATLLLLPPLLKERGREAEMQDSLSLA